MGTAYILSKNYSSLNHISHLATVEIRVVRLGSFQNLYLGFAIVEITHGVTANRDDIFVFTYYFNSMVINRPTLVLYMREV